MSRIENNVGFDATNREKAYVYTPYPKTWSSPSEPFTPIRDHDYTHYPDAAMMWRPRLSPFHRKPKFVNNFTKLLARQLFPSLKRAREETTD